MNILIPKITAYLIDRAVFLCPNEVVKAFNEQPSFAEGKPLKHFTVLSENTLRQICQLFWQDRDAHEMLVKGFQGAGVEKDENRTGMYQIALHGDKKACKQLYIHINHIKKACSPFNIKTVEIEDATFAQCSHIKHTGGQGPQGPYRKHEGGFPMKTPCKQGTGIFGGWFRRELNFLKERRRFVGITNNHVASVFDTYRPGVILSNEQGECIGQLETSIQLKPFTPLENKMNDVDLALIRPYLPDQVNLSLQCISDSIKQDCDAEADLLNNSKNDIILCNNKTGTFGKILKVLSSFYVNNGNEKYKFTDVIEIDIGDVGDSGSLLFDENSNLCGLFFAICTYKNGETRGYVNKWKYVKKAIEFNLKYN